VQGASGLRASIGFFTPTNGFLPASFLRGALSDFLVEYLITKKTGRSVMCFSTFAGFAFLQIYT
jgi:hypothetical protein